MGIATSGNERAGIQGCSHKTPSSAAAPRVPLHTTASQAQGSATLDAIPTDTAGLLVYIVLFPQVQFDTGGFESPSKFSSLAAHS